MFRQWLNWRSLLALVAICIVSGTIWYSSYLADKIENDEVQKVTLWVEAGKSLANPANEDVRLPAMILFQKEIPIIATTEKDSILEFVNLDSTKVAKGWPDGDTKHVLNDNLYLREKLASLKGSNAPVEWVDPLKASNKNYYYYG